MLYQLSYGRTAARKLGRRRRSVKQTLPVPWGLPLLDLTGERIAALKAVGDGNAKAPEGGKSVGRDSEVAREQAPGPKTGKERDGLASPSRDREARGMEMGLQGSDPGMGRHGSGSWHSGERGRV